MSYLHYYDPQESSVFSAFCHMKAIYFRALHNVQMPATQKKTSKCSIALHCDVHYFSDVNLKWMLVLTMYNVRENKYFGLDG